MTASDGFFRLILLSDVRESEVDMLFRDKDKPMFSKFLIILSLMAALCSALSAFQADVILASTQWLLIAVVLATWAIYWLLEAEFRS